MKQKRLTIITIIIITLFSLYIPDSARAQDPVVLKVATLAPGSGDWMIAFRKAIKEVEEKTKGRVSVKVYPGGVMGGDTSVLRKMRIGQLDGASFTAGGIATIYPDFQVLSIPLLFRNYEEVDYVRERIDPVIMKNLESKGYIPLFIADTGFIYLMSDRPIDNISSLKGVKVWIPEGDPIGRTVFEMAGVPPIPLPLADVLTGLRTGLIDTVSNTPSGALLLQWHTHVKYLTELPIMYGYGTLILSKSSYEKIPQQDRQIVREIIKEKMSGLSQSIREFNKKSLPVLKKQGIKFVPVTGKTREETEAFARKVRERLVEKNIFSKEIVHKIVELLDEYRNRSKK